MSPSPFPQVSKLEFTPEVACIEYLLSKANRFTAKKGQIILKVGDLQPSSFVFREGVVVAETQSPEGYIPTRFLSKGQGLAPLLSLSEPSFFQLRCLSACEYWKIETSAVVDACQTWPKFSLGFAASLIQRIAYMQLTQSRVVRLSLELQICFLFVSLGFKNVCSYIDEELYLPERIPQSLLAAYFGVSREEVNRKIKGLEKDGSLCPQGTGYLLTSTLLSKLAEITIPLPAPEFISSAIVSLDEAAQKRSARVTD